MQTKKLSNLQLELLELFAEQISEDELLDIKQLLSMHYAQKVIAAADKVWKNKKLSRKTAPMIFDECITELNSLLFDWVNYFKLGKGWTKLKAIDEWTHNRLRYCI